MVAHSAGVHMLNNRYTKKIMEFTINCTKVPIPQGTTLYVVPVGLGSAPALPGTDSDHSALSSVSDDGTASNLLRRAEPDRKEPVPPIPLRKCVFNHHANTIIS